MSTNATSKLSGRTSRTQIDNLSTRSLHGSGGSSYRRREAAALESQRIRGFLADPAPFSMAGRSVEAARNRMAQRIHEFGLAFDDGSRR